MFELMTENVNKRTDPANILEKLLLKSMQNMLIQSNIV